jgi:Flp pilus assembly protein protease CpaA
MLEVMFLFLLGLVWIIFASIQDLKTSEISNWLNYSLIIFALGFRLFVSLFGGDWSWFIQGAIGLGIFFVLSNILYYGKMFAGGDAKLMMALGVVLPIYSTFSANLEIYILFLLIFLVSGFVYGFLGSLYFGFKNFNNLKKEFKKQFKKNKRILLVITFIACLFLVWSFSFAGFFWFGVFLIFISYLYIFVKSVDEACMIKKVKPNKLMIGDWLYKDVKVGNKKIKATWNGLTKKDIALLKKNKKEVLIRYGIRFAPVFLIAYLILFLLLKLGLIERIMGFF